MPELLEERRRAYGTNVNGVNEKANLFDRHLTDILFAAARSQKSFSLPV